MSTSYPRCDIIGYVLSWERVVLLVSCTGHGLYWEGVLFDTSFPVTAFAMRRILMTIFTAILAMAESPHFWTIMFSLISFLVVAWDPSETILRIFSYVFYVIKIGCYSDTSRLLVHAVCCFVWNESERPFVENCLFRETHFFKDRNFVHFCYWICRLKGKGRNMSFKRMSRGGWELVGAVVMGVLSVT